jgi:chromatin remodeling complex protein RSC6|tara:strand:+ start:8 stop:493 length:486 start_codon:yes stop_codon:yes gene_type:complete
MSTEVAVTPNPSQTTTQDVLNNMANSITDLCTNLSQFNTSNRQLQQQVKSIYKDYRRERSKLSKNKRKKNNTKIHLPMNVSSPLKKFLKLDADELISKKDVMGRISTYVKEKNLQLPENKRQFKPNTALRRLFGLKKTKPMTFVEINKYISHHFPSSQTSS